MLENEVNFFETIPHGPSQTGQRFLGSRLNWRAVAAFDIRYAAFWSTLHKSSSITTDVSSQVHSATQ